MDEEREVRREREGEDEKLLTPPGPATLMEDFMVEMGM